MFAITRTELVIASAGTHVSLACDTYSESSSYDG
jgi:hypothetical protein